MTQTALHDPPAPAVTVPSPQEPPVVMRPGIDHAIERLAPGLWVLAILAFEVGTWMGERLRFPGDTAFQLVLVFAFLALGVRLYEKRFLHQARLALILSGLLAGFGAERWLLDAIVWLQYGPPPWPGERYVARTVHEVLSAGLHLIPALALLVWSGVRLADLRIGFGDVRRFAQTRQGQLLAVGLVVITFGVMALRFAGLVGFPETASARLGVVLLAAIYAVANAINAEVMYRGILLGTLEPVLGAEWANRVQSIAYGVGFLLYTGLALGVPGLGVGVGAVIVSYVFGRATLLTGGIGLLVIVHALATFLFEVTVL